MESKTIYEEISLYLIDHKKTIVVTALVTFITLIIYTLYDVPLEPVLYVTILTYLLLLLLSIRDFIKYHRRNEKIRDCCHHNSLDLSRLPEPVTTEETNYQTLITILLEQYRNAVSESDQRYTDLIEYYTLWVHQIKTPISAMRLLLQSDENASNEELSMELFRIEQYVEMVLQYLRIDRMSSDMVLEIYSLDHIIKQAVRKYAKVFIRKNISLHYEDVHCKVLTDEKWLVFVLEQLLSNALKYTNHGSIAIYMDETHPQTLVIEDTGIGIQPEDLPRIFEQGFTGYNGRMDKKSTGIGLYLCKQVLDKLSHTIHVTSELNKGTKFYLDLSHQLH